MEASAKANENIVTIFDALIREIEKDRGEPLGTKDGNCTIL